MEQKNMQNAVMQVILDRHSTRAYRDEPITDEHKAMIFRAVRESPSAGNMQTYSVIEIRDDEKARRLSVLCDNQPFIAQGKLLLLFVTNPLRYYDVYNETHEDKLNPTFADLYLNINDALIAAQTAVLAAESVGIGSCYIGDVIENYETVKEMFGLPKYVLPVCLLVMGYKTKEGISPKRFSEDDLFCVDTFQNDSFGAFAAKTGASPEEARKQTEELVDRLFTRKMKAPFFAEMNRSLAVMLDDYLN